MIFYSDSWAVTIVAPLSGTFRSVAPYELLCDLGEIQGRIETFNKLLVTFNFVSLDTELCKRF